MESTISASVLMETSLNELSSAITQAIEDNILSDFDADLSGCPNMIDETSRAVVVQPLNTTYDDPLNSGSSDPFDDVNATDRSSQSPTSNCMHSLQNLRTMPNRTNGSGEQTFCGSYRKERGTQLDVAGPQCHVQHPRNENTMPSWSMTREDKIKCGWSPGWEILTRHPSVPEKIYVCQPRSGPRPHGRTFARMSQRRRIRIIPRSKTPIYETGASYRNLASSSTTPGANFQNSVADTLAAQQEIPGALEYVDDLDETPTARDMEEMATRYMHMELFGSRTETDTDDDAILVRVRGSQVGHHHDQEGQSNVSVRRSCNGRTDCECNGRRLIKCRGRRILYRARKYAAHSKARIAEVFKH